MPNVMLQKSEMIEFLDVLPSSIIEFQNKINDQFAEEMPLASILTVSKKVIAHNLYRWSSQKKHTITLMHSFVFVKHNLNHNTDFIKIWLMIFSFNQNLFNLDQEEIKKIQKRLDQLIGTSSELTYLEKAKLYTKLHNVISKIQTSQYDDIYNLLGVDVADIE